MRNSIFLLLALLLVGSWAAGQGTLKGRTVDSLTGKPLGLATVTVFRAADTSIISYRLSTPDGDFKVPGLPLHFACRVVISFSGYGVYRKEFSIDSTDQLDLGEIKMAPDAKSLDEVLVIAERPPVVVKKDTIEFNASAFKTLPNALVEDLLKKLPGVQVDRDGNITVNGKPVNRILVDGKTFFGDDPKMASRNLPANVIDKVQVTDDKDEMIRNGDDNPNNVGKVVNITLKKGVKKGWFGKVYAGGGTDSRNELGGIANIYRDTLQVSVLGYTNNLNKPGFSFSELMQTGGLSRTNSNSSSNSISIWNNSSGGSGVSINGINFGGLQNYGGVSTSKGLGFNLNHSPNTKRSFYLQYFRTFVDVERISGSNLQQFSGDTVITNQSNLDGPVHNNGHIFGAGARLKPDSVNNILINFSYTTAAGNEAKNNDVVSDNSKLGPLSTGNVDQDNLSRLHYLRQSVMYSHLSRKKSGRRFSISEFLDINNKKNNNYTNSDLHFIYPTAFDSVYSQLRQEYIPRTDASLNFNHSEPLSKSITIRSNARYEYSWLHNDITTLNKNGGPDYTEENPLLTSRFHRTSHRGFWVEGVEFKFGKLLLTPGARLLVQSVDNEIGDALQTVRQHQTNILPSFGIRYNALNINYNEDVSLPSYTYLLPVTDNTNSYFIYKGNTGLKPAKRQNFSLNYYMNDIKRNLNAGAYANFSLSKNDVVQQITVDEQGIQTSMPVNADGSRNGYLNLWFNKQYKGNPKFTFSWNAGNNVNYNHSKLFFNGETSWQSTFGYSQWSGVSFNWNDKVEWNSSYNIYYNFTSYTSNRFKRLEVVNHGFDNEFVVRMPKHIIWETQVSYSYNGSIPNGLPKNAVRWNAAVNITMLKNEAGVLKLSVFDILNQNNNIWTNTSRNMIVTGYSNVLSRYVMATFTYNVRPSGASKKVGGRERFLLF